MLSFISNKFILEGISSRVIVIKNNSSKRKGYGANLAKNNEKNNLHHIIETVGINELGILSGCIYIDVNESKENLYLKLIFAIYNLSDDNGVEDHNDKTRLVISYNLHNDRKPLND